MAWSWHYQRAREVMPEGLPIRASSHTDILQVPWPRQESSLTTSSECPAKALPGDPSSRSREAKELPEELKEPELPKPC